MAAQRLTSATNRFRLDRLRTAKKTIAQYNHVVKNTQVAAIAAYASRMSWLQSKEAHQNSALQSRIEEDMYNHQNMLGRLQFARAGEKKWEKRAIARTVDTAQAKAHEENVIAAAARVRTAAAKSVSAGKHNKYAGKAKTAVNAQAAAAGLKAASAPSLVAGAAKQRAATRAKARAKAQKTAKASVAKTKAGRAASKKATVVKGKGRTASAGAGFVKYETYNKWIGDPDTPVCVPVAIANHLLYTAGVRMNDAYLGRFIFQCGYNPSIKRALAVLKSMTANGPSSWPSTRSDEYQYALVDYEPVPARYASGTGLVIGYKTVHGRHAALSLGNGTVVSWGQEISSDAEIEEAWMLDWVSSGRM
jgi:hypothetical protein